MAKKTADPFEEYRDAVRHMAVVKCGLTDAQANWWVQSPVVDRIIRSGFKEDAKKAWVFQSLLCGTLSAWVRHNMPPPPPKGDGL